MKYLAAYCLAALAGKEHPGANDVSAILKSVGIEPNQDSVNHLVEALKGKNLHEVVAHGLTKVSGLSLGGGSSGGHAKQEKGKKDNQGSPKKEPVKEPVKDVEPEKKEEDMDVGGLFDF